MTFDKQKYWEERNKAKEPKEKKKEPMMTELDIAYMTRNKRSHKNKKHTNKGCFGKCKNH